MACPSSWCGDHPHAATVELLPLRWSSQHKHSTPPPFVWLATVVTMVMGLAAAMVAAGSASAVRVAASSISASPYPRSLNPTQTLWALSSAAYTPSQLFTLATLDGALSRNTPTFFRVATDVGSDTDAAALWLRQLEATQKVSVELGYINGTFAAVIAQWRTQIAGYVLCNLGDDSTHAALTYLAAQPASLSPPPTTPSLLIAAAANDSSVRAVLQSLQIPMVIDLTQVSTATVFANYTSMFNKQISVLQDSSKFLYLSDYAIFAGAPTVYASAIPDKLLSSVLDNMTPNGAVLGWGPDEFNTVQALSASSHYIHAADWCQNIPALSNAATYYPNPLVQHNRVPAVTTPGVHTVCFLMTDGDNMQWLLSGFATDPNWYASPDRGRTNIGWTMSPGVGAIAPTALSYFYQKASSVHNAADQFVAAPSGIGYAYPDSYPSAGSTLSDFVQRTADFMNQTDMHVLNVITAGDGTSPVLDAFVAQPQIDAVFAYPFSDYSGLNGAIRWSANDKPIIGGRYNLWSPGFENVTSLAQKLHALPKDITSADGYSLIPVHVWSHNVSDVVAVTELLDNTFHVVTPEQFQTLIRQNVKH